MAHNKLPFINTPVIILFEKNEVNQPSEKLINNFSQKEAFRKTFTITSTLN